MHRITSSSSSLQCWLGGGWIGLAKHLQVQTSMGSDFFPFEMAHSASICFLLEEREVCLLISFSPPWSFPGEMLLGQVSRLDCQHTQEFCDAEHSCFDATSQLFCPSHWLFSHMYKRVWKQPFLGSYCHERTKVRDHDVFITSFQCSLNFMATLAYAQLKAVD